MSYSFLVVSSVSYYVEKGFKEYRKSIGANGAKDYFLPHLMHICILQADGWMGPGLIQTKA